MRVNSHESFRQLSSTITNSRAKRERESVKLLLILTKKLSTFKVDESA